MNQPEADEMYRVVYSTGGAFYTKARTVSEYMLDPIFIQFMVLSVFMFSALMLALELPITVQLVLFGAGVVSTFFWMSFQLLIYLFALKILNGKTIYTLVLLIPMQVTNAVMMDQVLSVFGTSYSTGFNDFWDMSIRTAIIILCLDIFHGRFVAPQHGKFAGIISPSSGAPEPPQPIPVARPQGLSHYIPAHSLQGMPVSGPVVAAAPIPAVADRFVSPAQAGSLPNTAMDAVQPTQKGVVDAVKIGNEKFDLATLRFIRSEDHYLLVQRDDDSSMVRGRLRDVSATIDVSWGVQVNRSVWVAHSAIASFNDPSSGPMELVLKDDTRIRVSETRRVLLKHSYQQFLDA